MSDALPPSHSAGCPLEDVIITDSLRTRPPRVKSMAAEQDAFAVISNAMLTGPERLLELLVEYARRLCGAHSAGISIEDLNVDPPLFRWPATSGRFSHLLHGTMPRFFSPCGETLARSAPVLMAFPERHYTYMRAIEIPLHEALLVPFATDGKLVGTVWIVSHDEVVKFCADDVRVVRALADFAGHAVATINRSSSRLRSGRSDQSSH